MPDGIRISKPDVRKYLNHLKLDGDWAVTSDYHVPYFSALWMERVLRTMNHYHIPNLIIVGDFWDMTAFSKWGAVDLDAQFPAELEAGRTLISEILPHVDKLVFLIGNHDRRMIIQAKYQMTFRMIMNLIPECHSQKITVSEYPYADVGDTWRLIHPKSYSRVTGKIAADMAEKYERNIIMAHGHRAQASFSRSGKYKCIDSGGLFDAHTVEYYNMQPSNGPAWNSGFVILRNEYPMLFTEMTDWSRALRGRRPGGT